MSAIRMVAYGVLSLDDGNPSDAELERFSDAVRRDEISIALQSELKQEGFHLRRAINQWKRRGKPIRQLAGYDLYGFKQRRGFGNERPLLCTNETLKVCAIHALIVLEPDNEALIDLLPRTSEEVVI